MSHFSTSRTCLRLAGLALAVLFLGGTAWAQVGTTQIYGEVLDPQGAAIVGAKVTLTNPATGATRSSETDSVGRYQFLALSPGRYNLKVEMTGFRTAVRDRIDLAVDTISKLNVTLEIGAITETVVVAEAAAALNTTDASLGNVITGDQIRELPLEGRNIVGLLSLQAGATYVPKDTGTTDPRFGSVSGARADQQNVTLDGIDVNDQQNQTAYTSVLRMTVDAVQEFRVTTTNADATAGRSSGPQVSMVTRSGSNEIHGATYWYHRNTATSSNEYFLKLAGQPTPVLQKHIFGAAAGGPIIKDRLFIFGNFEALREKRQTSAERAVPTASFRDGVLIYQCATASSCPGGTVAGFSNTHTIPAGFFGLRPADLAVIDPLGLGSSMPTSTHFRQYPLPNDTGRDGFFVGSQIVGNIAAFRFGAPLINEFYTNIARVDFHIDRLGNHKLYWRGNLQDDFIDGTPQFPGQPPATSFVNNSKGMAIGYTAVLNPRWVNVFRYGYTRIGEQTAGLRTSNAVVFRFITDFNALTSSNGRIIPTHNVVNDTTWTMGKHTFQWGIAFRWVRAPRFTNGISFHTAVANGSWVSGVGRTYMPGAPACAAPAPCSVYPAVASAGEAVYADSFINVLGILSQASARYNYDKTGALLPNGEPIKRKYGADEYEWYFQDTWRMRPNLTFTLGVRYGLFSPPWEVDGNQVAPNISLGNWFRQRGANAAQGIPSNAIPPFQIALAGPANGGVGFYEWDKNNWAPRAAMAYSPRFASGPLGWLTGNGKMVIRVGYSMVFDRIGQGLATTFDTFGSFGMSTSLTSPFGVNNEDAPGIRFINITTMPPHLPAAPPGGFPATPPSAAGVITTSIDDTITIPYAHSFNVAVGRELPANMSVEFAYVGRRGRNLLVRRDLAMPVNLVDPASGLDYFTAATRLIQATQAAGIPASAARSAYAVLAPIPYWENLFPSAANLTVDMLTATQEVARRFNRDNPDFITSIWLMDQFCFPACSIFGPFAYFNDQYDSLSGQSSIGVSEYHGLQITLRRNLHRGLGFDLNYTMSKAHDMGSSVERGGSFSNFFTGGYTGFLLNSWEPRKHYALADFDVRHQFNFNWLWELPFGRDKWIGSNAPGVVEQIIGGWQVSGLLRWTSSFPFNVINCRSCWPTNWNLQGNASLATPGVLPATETTKNAVGGRPSPFVNASTARTLFRRSFPGEIGLRNVLRGDGYYAIDLAISKSWKMWYAEGHRFRFRWETFNLTNTPKFDVGDITAFPDIGSSFGRYNSTLATCDNAAGRCMQFSFRYEF